MKKILFIVLLICFLVCGVSYANERASFKRLNDSAGTALTAFALTSGSAVYSETIDVSNSTNGFMSLLITENIAGGAGDVDISAQYSIDGSNWYTAYTTNMSGTLSAEGLISEALGNSTRWIVFTPRISKYMRIKLDPDANSKVTVDFIYQYSR